jgi:predicted methyltransferase MtxX (methanogen marker protein 4)
VIIDCDDCAVRGAACKDCVVSVLLGTPDMPREGRAALEVLDDERAALEALAEVGLAPRLRLVPIHRRDDTGVA